MANKLNPFEQELRNSVEKHSVSYDSSQWDQLEKKLNSSSPGSTINNWYKIGLIAAAMIVVGVGLSVIDSNNRTERIVQSSFELTESMTSNEEEVVDELKLQVTTSPVREEIVENHSEQIVEEASTETESTQLTNSFASEVNEKIEPVQVENQPNVLTNNETPIQSERVNENIEMVLPKIVLLKNSICAGEELSANLENQEYENVEWHLGNGKTVTGKELNYVYLHGGNYKLKAFVSELNAFTPEIDVQVKSKPDPSFTVRENIERGVIPVKYLSADVGGERSYTWSLGDGTTLKGEGVSHTYRKAGEYEVSLRVTNKLGCSWETYKRVTIDNDFNLLAPNSFSPNGDGINDEWIPVALKSGYYNFELKVYNRNSVLVFETSNPEEKFDGRDHGTLAPSGEIFIWKAFTEDPNGVRQEYGGTMMSIY